MRWTLLAAAVAALLSLGLGPRGEDGPRVQLVDGTLSLQNSREGQAVFSAENIPPGGSAGGSVTVSNTGTLAGDLSLTQSGPEPSSEPLAQQLQLVVQDVTGSPATVYAGPLSGLDSVELGTLAPGAAREYSFTTSLPAAADHSVAGASTTVSYTWTATEDVPDEPPPNGRSGVLSPGTSLRDPLRLRVRVPRRQVVRRGRLIVYARCDQTCSVRGSARLATSRGRAVRTRSARMSRLRAGREVRLTLRLSKRARKRLSRAPRRPTSARVTVTARSAAGSERTVRKRIRIAWR